jgi:DNA-binding transcriptional ArsR family regulator
MSEILPQQKSKHVGDLGMKALAAPVRRAIIDLLGDRPATVTDLATTLGKAKGTIAHHIDVLVDAEMVEVVSTRRVRAMEERTYGRAAPTFVLPTQHLASLSDSWMLEEAAESARASSQDEAGLMSVRFARVPNERAAEFGRRLSTLLDDFVAEPRHGDVVYGLLVALFPTDRPHLPDRKTR